MWTHFFFRLVLGALIFVLWGHFCDILKRESLVLKALRNPALLSRWITFEALSNPTLSMMPYLQKKERGYVLNVFCVVQADRAANRRLLLFFGLCSLALLVVSLLHGFATLICSSVWFLLRTLVPLSPGGISNAREHILTIAAILRLWRGENQVDCDSWISMTPVFKHLYECVKNMDLAIRI